MRAYSAPGWSGTSAAFLLCAAAPSFGALLFFRFLQGIGAGLIISCAPALVTSLYPEARRSHALGVFTLMFAIGSASGPLIGGALVEHWGWPAVFWFRAPIALAGLLLLRGLPRRESLPRQARAALRYRRGAAAGVGSRDAAARGQRAAAFAGRRHAGPPAAPGRLRQPRRVRLVGDPHQAAGRAGRAVPPCAFAVINAASCLLYLVTFSVMLISPYFLVHHTGLSLPQAGLVLASGFVAMALTSPLAGRIVARFGAGRIAPVGALAIGAGLFSIGNWQPDTAPSLMVLSLAVQGCGLACFQVAYMELVMAATPPAHRGVAGSLGMLTRTIGTVTGASLLTLGFPDNPEHRTGRRRGGAGGVSFRLSCDVPRGRHRRRADRRHCRGIRHRRQNVKSSSRRPLNRDGAVRAIFDQSAFGTA